MGTQSGTLVEAIQADLRRREEEERRRNRILGWMRGCAFLILLFLVWVASFSGRTDLVNMQRFGCERVTQDRLSNARAWLAAADRASGDIVVARRYTRAARSFIRRAGVPLGTSDSQIKVVCMKRYPDPGPFAIR